MRVLLANKYFYKKGGAETAFLQTGKLLAEHGHKVSFFSMHHERNPETEYNKYFVSNVDYDRAGFASGIGAASKLIYSFEAKAKIEQLIKDQDPDWAYLNNIYHQISPSILHALKKYNIPVAMALHDYKLVCASYLLFDGMGVCEACRNGRYYRCLLRKCVKGSRAKSLLNVMEMYLHHNILKIYDLVDIFVSPSRFLMSKLREMGFRGNIVYLPNCVNLEAYEPVYRWRENSIVYFGRLAKEKGLFTLLEAMRGVKNVTLKIIGEGIIKEELESIARNQDNVRFLGYKHGEDLKKEIANSMFTVLPSEWYENNPLAAIEGFALGKPVLGANIGGIPELIADGQRGLTFKAGNAQDLKGKIMRLSGDPDGIERMGRNARKFVEDELNEKTYYEKMMSIYESISKR